MSEPVPTDEELLALADAASARAYSPYSNFNVGCVVVARDGRMIEGVNVENAAYPLGVCAERTAFSRAVSRTGTKTGLRTLVTFTTTGRQSST